MSVVLVDNLRAEKMDAQHFCLFRQYMWRKQSKLREFLLLNSKQGQNEAGKPSQNTLLFVTLSKRCEVEVSSQIMNNQKR